MLETCPLSSSEFQRSHTVVAPSFTSWSQPGYSSFRSSRYAASVIPWSVRTLHRSGVPTNPVFNLFLLSLRSFCSICFVSSSFSDRWYFSARISPVCVFTAHLPVAVKYSSFTTCHWRSAIFWYSCLVSSSPSTSAAFATVCALAA